MSVATELPTPYRCPQTLALNHMVACSVIGWAQSNGQRTWNRARTAENQLQRQRADSGRFVRRAGWAACRYDIEPNPLRIEFDLAPPPRLTTRISAKDFRAGPPCWYNLRESTAAFRATLSLRVDGPLAEKTALKFKLPAGVKRVEVLPHWMHRGDQVLQLAVLAEVCAAPDPTILEFVIEPPTAQGPVDFKAEGAAKLHLIGPPRPS